MKKQLIIICDVSGSDDINELLLSHKVDEFTRFEQCSGQGHRTGPRTNDHIWPGYNVMYVTVIDEALAVEVMNDLRVYRDANPNMGIYAYTTPVELII
ncbi:MAG: hypothetical protein J6V70_08470 [Kiritimatiellae bacterium]|nr:hypothetical protein [Kiritimatiellia bacterium]